MGPITEAKIVSWNTEGEKICASAARISTTPGNALDILEQAGDTQKDQTLIKQVLNSGHKSILEHGVFTLAFCNVSVLVEQFFIEFRLASYTVKSRRYVDFGNMGYYIPPDLTPEQQEGYQQYMDRLFAEYQFLLTQGIPKEDARFVLPYAFFSNFYCTVNARELLHMLQTILYGRGGELPELRALAQQLVEQLKGIFPSLVSELERTEGKFLTRSQKEAGASHSLANSAEEQSVNQRDCGEKEKIGDFAPVRSVALLQAPQDEVQSLFWAQITQQGLSLSGFPDLSINTHCVQQLVKELFQDPRPRALEQLTYTFLIEGISLAGLTHLVRHRMQSLVVPSLATVQFSRYILPETIGSKADLRMRYQQVFQDSARAYQRMQEQGVFTEQAPSMRGYFALSGHLLNVLTTMNAREFLLFFQLRTCNRAQWEIKEIAREMLQLLRQKCPILFNRMGPSCFVQANCPEGKMTCGKMLEVRNAFAADQDPEPGEFFDISNRDSPF